MSETETAPTTEEQVPEEQTTEEQPQEEELPEEELPEEEMQEEVGEEAGEEADPAELEEEEDELTVDLDALPKMKVSELKDILKALDLPISGIKTTLIERIQQHFAEEDKQEEAAGAAEGEVAADPAVAAEKVADAEESELLKENQPAAEFIEIKKTEDTDDTKPAMTDEEKKKARAEKFGLQSDEEKKEVRAAKFGIDTDSTIEAKKEERAAKFGIDTPKTVSDKKAERLARFGNNTANTNKLSISSQDKTVEMDKLNKRKARFNLDAESTAKSAKIVKLDDISEKLKEKIESGSTKVNLSAAGLSLEEKKKLRALKFGA